MRVLFVCLFLLATGSLCAQNVVNQLDAQGRKQGFWSKKDREGRLVYEGTFKDDKPVGEMKRYHPNGRLMAKLNYIAGTDQSGAELYDEAGKLIAKGNYLGQKKTGEWTYYSDSKIVMVETYTDGLREGNRRRFYNTGELLEESTWKADKLSGVYKSYFRGGKVYLECNYVDGQLNGSYKSLFENGQEELDAFYSKGVRDKDWLYYNASGKLLFTLKYNQGTLLNPEVQDSVTKARSGDFQTGKTNIPDPEKYMQDPDEYMRLMNNR